MPITLTQPATVPAVEERVFDELWLSELHIIAPPAGPVRVFGTVEKARTLDNGDKEFAPGGSERIQIDDFFTQAELEAQLGNNEMLQVMGALLTLIKRKGNL